MEKPDPIKIKQKMSAKDLQLFNMEYERQRKKTGMAYLLWFFLGGFGVHQAYLERTDMTAVHLGAIGFLIFSVFYQAQDPIASNTALWAITAIWIIVSGFKLIYDLFTLGDQVKQANAKIEAKIISSIQG